MQMISVSIVARQGKWQGKHSWHLAKTDTVHVSPEEQGTMGAQCVRKSVLEVPDCL